MMPHRAIQPSGVALAWAGALALSLLIGPARGEERLRAGWKLAGNEMAVWDLLDVQADGSERECPREKAVCVFGYEIAPDNAVRMSVTSLEEVPVDLALQLPAFPLRPELTWAETRTYDQITGHPDLQLKVSRRVAAVSTARLVIEGEATQAAPPPEGARPPAYQDVSVTWTTFFDRSKGLITEARLVCTGTEKLPPNAEGETPAPASLLWNRVLRLRRILVADSTKLDPAVAAAIDRGVAFLSTRRKAEGEFGAWYDYKTGETAIATLTQLVCGADRSDPALLAQLDRIRSAPMETTYEVGLSLMAVEAFYAAPDEADRIHRGELRGPAPRRPSPEDREWMIRAVAFLRQTLEKVPEGAYFTYRPGQEHEDLSNTQYGVLGLLAAWRCGIDVEEEIWVELGRRLVFSRGKEGTPVRLSLLERPDPRATMSGKRVEAHGWPYRADPNAQVYGSMTCGAIASMAIIRDVLQARKSRHARGKLGRGLDECIRQGWGWLASNWSIQRNPPAKGRSWLIYYLYGLERSGVLSRTAIVNGHDWYAEGAAYLVATQEESGQWTNGGGLHHTCFALLFLKRGTVPATTGE